MSRERLATVGESVALILPKEALERLRITSGDEVEVSLYDRTLLLQPLDEAARSQTYTVGALPLT
jgi:antitoxin component of MazEF toxin-antitoxin module